MQNRNKPSHHFSLYRPGVEANILMQILSELSIVENTYFSDFSYYFSLRFLSPDAVIAWLMAFT
jgi:hypothetical protein